MEKPKPTYISKIYSSPDRRKKPYAEVLYCGRLVIGKWLQWKINSLVDERIEKGKPLEKIVIEVEVES